MYTDRNQRTLIEVQEGRHYLSRLADRFFGAQIYPICWRTEWRKIIADALWL